MVAVTMNRISRAVEWKTAGRALAFTGDECLSSSDTDSRSCRWTSSMSDFGGAALAAGARGERLTWSSELMAAVEGIRIEASKIEIW